MNVALRPDLGNGPDSGRYLSICTGGAGLDLGLHLAMPGSRAVAMVEREAFAVAHLVAAMQAGLLAPAPVWDDAKTFDGRQFRGHVSGVVGGIPCQPHSLAGRRRGHDDPRDLWADFRRILVQSGARWCLVENVTGMLSAGNGLVAGAERVWRDLQRLGYRVEGGLFSAAEVGAPHERQRLFILGVLADADGGGRWSQGDDGKQAVGTDWCGSAMADGNGARSQGQRPGDGADRWQEPDGHVGLRRRTGLDDPARGDGGLYPRWRGEGERTADARGAGETVVDAASERRREGRSEPGLLGGRGTAAGDGLPTWPPGPGDFDGWCAVLERVPALEPAVRRVADGLAGGLDPHGAARVDRLRMLGNGVVPLVAGHAFRTLATRAAGAGNAVAGELVRLMEDI